MVIRTGNDGAVSSSAVLARNLIVDSDSRGLLGQGLATATGCVLQQVCVHPGRTIEVRGSRLNNGQVYAPGAPSAFDDSGATREALRLESLTYETEFLHRTSNVSVVSPSTVSARRVCGARQVRERRSQAGRPPRMMVTDVAERPERPVRHYLRAVELVAARPRSRPCS